MRATVAISFLCATVAFVALTRAKEPGDDVLKLFLDEFIAVTPGKGKFPASFQMGSSAKDAPETEKPVVKVTFKTPFAIAKYEVTQELWTLVTGNNPSRWKGKRNSVEMLDWNEANTFCAKVTKLLHERKLLDPKEVIRLPSEAEWEYVARAGTTTQYSFGDDVIDLGEHAWYIRNSKGEDPPVGRKKPNAWGLYDVHGYVWEWCADAWSDDHKGAASDGSARVGKDVKERVIRGGSFADPADSLRCAYRGKALATAKSDRLGLRCVKAVKNAEERK